MVELRGYKNLWGRSIGQLNQKTLDVNLNIDHDVSPPQFDIEIDTATTKIRQIPENSKIRLSIRKRLRIHHYDCGTLGNPKTPSEIDAGDNKITKFGEDYGDAKWTVRFVDPTEPGRNHAWTTPARLVPIPSALGDGKGSSLIDIEVDQSGKLNSEAWSMSFEDDNPTIMINPSNVELKEAFSQYGTITYLIIPEVFSRIMDEIISEHIDQPISPGESRWQERFLRWSYDQVGIEKLPSKIDSVDEVSELNAWKKKAIGKVKEKIAQSDEIRKAMKGDEKDGN